MIDLNWFHIFINFQIRIVDCATAHFECRATSLHSDSYNNDALGIGQDPVLANNILGSKGK